MQARLALASRRISPALCCVACAVTCAALVTRAVADPPSAAPPLNLDWTAPIGCPSRDEVIAEVAQLLGRSASRAPLAAHASVVQDDHRANPWRVSLETVGTSGVGRRELRARTCGELADATALILALTIDPNAALVRKADKANDAGPGGSGITPPVSSAPPALPAPSAPPGNDAAAPATPAPAASSAASPNLPAPSPSPSPSPSSAPSAVPALATSTPSTPATPATDSPSNPRTPATSSSVGLSFGPTAAVATGLRNGEGASMGVGGTVALSVRPLLFDLAVLFWPREEHALDETAGVGGTLTRVSFQSSVCPFARADPFRAGGCGIFDLTYARATAYGPANLNPAEESGAWASLGAGGFFAWHPVKAFHLVLRVEAIAPLRRPAFVIAGLPGVVYEPPTLEARGLLGAEVSVF